MKRFLVVGCGGIGGNVAAGLLSHPPELVGEVVGLSTNQAISDAVNTRGYRVIDGAGTRVIQGRIVPAIPHGTLPFDYVILATQPPQVEAAAREVAPFLAAQGAMVVLQNGLCEDRIAAIVGPERVFGAVVAWGASMNEPGVYTRTSEGGFVLGRPDGKPDPRLDELSVLLEAIGPVTLTENLAGARWSKLAINCGISTLGTIGGDRLGALMRLMFARRLGLEIVTEVVEVARAEGIKLEKVVGTVDLEWLSLKPGEKMSKLGSPGLLMKHSLMLAVGARYRNLRSSMLAAIERGRPPAVDFLNGEVSLRGKKHGIPTPFNDAATDVVHAIARGEAVPSVATLRGLFDATRAFRGIGDEV